MGKLHYYLAAAAVFALAPFSHGDIVDFVLEYDESAYTETEVTGGDGEPYILIEYEGANLEGFLEEPRMPTIAYDAVIPFGSTNVSVEIVESTYYDAEDVTYPLYPGQQDIAPDDYQDFECPECEPTEWEWTDMGDIYEEDAAYPAGPLLDASKGLARGHFASQWTLCLLSYNPVQEFVEKLESITVRVNYDPPFGAPEAERWEWEHVYDKWSDYLQTFVLNPDDVYDYREPVNFVDVIGYDEYEKDGEIVKVAYNQESEYFSSSVPIDDDVSWPEDASFAYPYIIITNDKAWYYDESYVDIGLTGALGDFRTWKKDKGIPTLVKTVDEIKTRYAQEGDEYWDWQVAVRKFLKAQLKNGYEYVLFVGDVDRIDSEPGYQKHWGKWGVVPIRVMAKKDYDPQSTPPGRADVIPSDIYYTDLNIEGDWNGDNDNYFGEPEDIEDEEDFKPDVACGWIPASSTTELSNWTAKLIKYEKNPNLEKIGDHTYLHRALHVVADTALSPYEKERELFGKNYVPPEFFRKSMWEGGGGLPSWPLQSWPTYPEPYQVTTSVNQGFGLIEIDTHGHIYFFDLITRGNNAGRIQSWASDQDQRDVRVHRTVYPSTVAELYSEKERYGVLYSESCNINDFSFDDHSGAQKPVCEHFIFNDHGGSVAFIGTTRSGSWGGDSLSARLRNHYYKILMNKTGGDDEWDDDGYFIGPALTWARYHYFRETAEETKRKYDLTYMHMLTGDPEMNVWTDDPCETDMFVYTNPVSGQPYYEVEVHVKYLEGEQKKNLYLANVCAHGTGGTYLLNLSNLNGVCAFRVRNTTPSVKITATKHNYVPVVRTAFKP